MMSMAIDLTGGPSQIMPWSASLVILDSQSDCKGNDAALCLLDGMDWGDKDFPLFFLYP